MPRRYACPTKHCHNCSRAHVITKAGNVAVATISYTHCRAGWLEVSLRGSLANTQTVWNQSHIWSTRYVLYVDRIRLSRTAIHCVNKLGVRGRYS